MMLKSSPVRCTILTLAVVTFKREQNKNTLQGAPVWSRPNTLRRLSQKSFYNSRVLERSQSRVPLCEEDVGAFIVVRSCLLSLQSKSSLCRTSLILAAQVLSLQSKSSGIWNVVGKSGPSFCQGLHTKNGLDLLLVHGHEPGGVAEPYLIFYPLQKTLYFLLINSENFHV